MKRRTAIVSIAALGALLVPPASPASAHTSCSLGGSKGSSWTRAYANDCTRAQARIDRYITSYPTAYYGSWSSSSSYVSNSNGVNSGNYVRADLHGEIGGWNRL